MPSRARAARICAEVIINQIQCETCLSISHTSIEAVLYCGWQWPVLFAALSPRTPRILANTPGAFPFITMTQPSSVLSIAGSDSGGGPGSQAYLNALTPHVVHGLSVFAALCARHTRGGS